MSENRKLCPTCGHKMIREYDAQCAECNYADQVRYTMSLDADDQDWEFAFCEECGSSLDSRGYCRNQNCGNSPDIGKDWL